MKLESDVITGDIGSVRNQLAILVRDSVKNVVSLSQSSSGSISNMLTVVIIYEPKIEDVQFETKSICTCEGCQCNS